ncbi:hypothetical protein CTAYLR_000918 [Chrysophaeum taylorii]|uniref:Uncharacterized protein n=1 Tax=Chrysophaeum taylorii TaxID=2483200 RepID=A0AAD7UGM6_9STRA|nr:hypothetical protein CTAYLR_000918 [Chrysophaeum taylorii]
MEAFGGKWQTIKSEGDFNGFLTERGVPLPVRKTLELFTSKATIILGIADGMFLETEVGVLSNTEHPSLPLDGAPVEAKSPAGDEILKAVKFDGTVVAITETSKSDPSDVVLHELKLEGTTLVRKIVNVKTGTNFTTFLQKV